MFLFWMYTSLPLSVITKACRKNMELTHKDTKPNFLPRKWPLKTNFHFGKITINLFDTCVGLNNINQKSLLLKRKNVWKVCLKVEWFPIQLEQLSVRNAQRYRLCRCHIDQWRQGEVFCSQDSSVFMQQHVQVHSQGEYSCKSTCVSWWSQLSEYWIHPGLHLQWRG